MFTLQCTKKLESELGMMDFVAVPTAVDPLFGWHAHLFLLNRRKCVLVMNNETRYNFVLHGLKKQDFLDAGGEIDAQGLYNLNRFLNKFVMLKLPLAYSGETMLAALDSRQL